MEPPKKRKYPADTGTCGLVGVVVKAEMEEGVYSDQHHVVSNSGGGPQPAKRNRRSYSLEFKVAVLDSYYNDPETKLNQRKTALKYGVNRRQIQKWLAQEETLRGSVGAGYTQNHSLGQIPNFTPINSTPLPPASSTTNPAQSEQKSPLSNYLHYQSKIDYLRRLSPPPEHTSSVTVVEVTPEIGSGEEGDYVIDESDSYQPSGDYRRSNDYPDNGLDDDEQFDNKPINLSKAVESKRDDQVDSTRDTRDAREQMNEVGSSVATSTLQTPYTTSPPHLNNQAEALKKPRSHPDPVSSHILDTSVGLPARGVAVTMYRMGGEQIWTKLQSRVTNDDGRASNFLSWEDFRPGTYKMHFSTGQYFKERATETFYPYAEVVFEIKDAESHYHVPLLLNPYGYSTYRGS